MKRELWNKIVEEIGAHSPETEIWPTFYGEALIMGYKSELWDRIDYAAKVGCRNLVLNSNGTLLDRWDNTERILASPLRRFILSLDGLSRETFELIREKATRSIPRSKSCVAGGPNVARNIRSLLRSFRS
jgi:MoaA/NifB/PqqE/SkfB family radical SAM enzyme